MHEGDETEETKKLFYDTLTEVGYEVIYAETGAEAIDVAQQQLPVLIFMGVLLASGLNGFKAMRGITKNPLTQYIPIIPMTRKNFNSDKAWAKMPGAKDFLTSPYTKEKILSEVKKVEKYMG